MEKRKKDWLVRFDGRKGETAAILPAGHKRITSFSPIATAACNYLSEKMIPSHFSEAIARNSFMADLSVLAKYSNRDPLFVSFATLTDSQELEFDTACQKVLVHFLKVIKDMIETAVKYTLALEQVALEDEKRAVLGSAKKKKKKKVKPPEERFETAFYKFMQSEHMTRFMTDFPANLGSDRLFSLLVLQSLLELVREWTKEAIKAAPSSAMPLIPSLERSLPKNKTHLPLVSVDLDSELHRFVASGVCAYKKLVKDRIRDVESRQLERLKKNKPPKPRHDKSLKKWKDSKLLLDKLGILRKDIPKQHDKSYDSETMRALDRGGLLYVAPAYLRWAKQLMKTIRASISLEVIRENGTKAQEKAYQHINQDGVLLKLFQESIYQV